MPASPQERYQKDLLAPGFVEDSAQRAAVACLQALYDQLVQRHRQRSRWPGFVARRLYPAAGFSGIQGLYFWGGVGRGKTYLMDIFFDALPFENKMRTHFHRFMRRVHEELKQHKGRKNPLQPIADTLAEEAGVICFDEFFVVDITDAMILATLLQALFERGVVLVATSNIQPDGLYRDGLQRTRFLPAIALLNQHTRVVNVDGGVDYRLRALEKANLYHDSGLASTASALQACFESLVPDPESVQRAVALEINTRSIVAKRLADDVAWFEFASLCDGPRSQNDYIELAREFHAVVVESVPVFDGSNDDQARRFIYLVDEFYDRNVKLVLSAQQPIEKLYAQGRLDFEFERTASRILEMQSKEYLARAHKA